MSAKSLSLILPLILAVIAFTTLAAPTRTVAQTEKIVQNFRGTISAGGYPNGGLIVDSAGNIYGTTAASGNSCTSNGCGTVFKLVPESGGNYSRAVIHVFTRSGTGAWNPQAGLTMDASGNLYGTTYNGGPGNSGTVFKLTPTDGPWKFALLHSFGANKADGATPAAAVTLDAAGNVYGTTSTGGTGREGVVYELSPKTGGGYSYAIVHAFKGPDGATPWGPLVFDSAGNLYGVAEGGGANKEGAIYELTPVLGGGWTQNVIYSFATSLGNAPFPYLAMDSSGNLYGTANGGNSNGGVAFELSPVVGGTWSAQIIYEFCTAQGCPYGIAPAGLIFDDAGNLYGLGGLGAYGEGTAVELSPQVGGTWSATLLHSFGNGQDGAQPIGTPLYYAGNLYGSTTLGGEYGFGTVFEITP